MKSRLKYSLNLCLLISALVLTSCGKKENKVNSSGASGSSPFNSSNSAFNSSAGSTIINQVQSIKTNVACNGGYRLTNDVSFYVQGGAVSATRISGTWQQGFNSSGTVTKLWVGVSAFRDIMFVTQLTNGGSQVIGYNVTISFCELKSKDAYGNVQVSLPSVISNERELYGFATPYGIILDTNTYCGYSVVDLAQYTLINSRRNASNPYSQSDAINIPTSFSKPTCNGQF